MQAIFSSKLPVTPTIGYVRTTNDQISFSLLPTKYYVKFDDESQMVKKTPKRR